MESAAIVLSQVASLVQTSTVGTSFAVTLPVRIAPWLRRSMRWMFLAFVVGGASTAFLIYLARPGNPSLLLLFSTLAVAIGTAAIGLAILLYMVVKSIHQIIRIDATERRIEVHDLSSLHTIPIDDIHGIQVVVDRVALDFDPEQSPRKVLRRRPIFAIDVRTPHGRLRCFRGRDRHTLGAAAKELNNRLSPALDAATQLGLNDRVIAVTTATYGPQRRWLPRIGVIMGIAMILWASWDGLPACRSYGWPAASAEVTHSRWQQARGNDRFTAEVSYRYTVAGVEYTGHRIGFGRMTAGNFVHDVLLANPAGSRTDIFYDPERPGRSTLIRGAGIWMVLPIVAGVIVLAMSTPFLFGLPTREQEALVGRYRTTAPPRMRAEDARLSQPADSEFRWTESPAQAAESWRRRSWKAVQIAGRIFAVSTLLSFAARYAFGDVFPDAPWEFYFALVIGWTATCFAAELASLLRRKLPKPETFAVTEKAFTRTHVSTRSEPWDGLDSFEVDETNGQPELVLHSKQAPAIHVALPERAVTADQAVEAVARHLPQRQPQPRFSPIRTSDVVIGMIVTGACVAAIAAAIDARIVRSHHIARLFIVLALAGPGTLIAPFLWRRRAGDAIFSLACILNVTGVMATAVTLLAKSLPALVAAK